HGVGVDDDAARLPRQPQRQCRLAAGGRPRYQDRALESLSRQRDSSMPLVATLVSNPAARALAPPLPHKVRDALGASALDWLAERVVGYLTLPACMSAPAASAAIGSCLDGAPIDFSVQDAAGRRQELLIANMDSTMIDQECIDELADEVGI